MFLTFSLLKFISFGHLSYFFIYSSFKLDEKNPCTTETCKNGGICFSNNPLITKCVCKEGFKGENCEIMEHGKSY